MRPTVAGALLTLGLLGACGGDPEMLSHLPRPVLVEELHYIHTPLWMAEAADLDGDGHEELLLVGHRGRAGPAYCVLDGAEPCATLQPFLAPGRDRHHCAIGDVDADGDPDLYCTTGAERGRGPGPNELWRNDGAMRFTLEPEARGAREDSSRGRLATFFSLDDDHWPDLISTTWGARSDGAENRSKVWTNERGRLRQLALRLPASFGARCMAVLDINGDGLQDILGCPEQTGLTAMINVRGRTLSAVPLGSRRDWYWDLQLLRGDPHRNTLLVATGGTRGEMYIEIAELSRTPSLRRVRRIACAQADIDSDRDIYCGRLLLADADGDGHRDILVSRRRGWRNEVVLGDAPDLLLYGPDFRRFTDLPPVSRGAGERLLESAIGILQVNAGEGWPGPLRRLRLAPVSPASAAP